jgi:hypothetical protein
MAIMVSFTVVLKKFEDQGEKTGWTYIEISPAKTEPTKTKRIAMTIRAMERHQDYGAMIRESKAGRL